MEEPRQPIMPDNVVLLTLVGSTLHGTGQEGQEDIDQMGICIEDPFHVLGLNHFEQYQFRSKPEGVRSEAGDLDLVIYSLRKYMRLALQGNPSILLPLYVKDPIECNKIGHYLRANTDKIASKQAGMRFLGYLRAQKERLEGTRGGRHGGKGRPELEEAYGFDTKFAMHMLRLGFQGIEFLETGRLELPIPNPTGDYLRGVRTGQVPKDECIAKANELEAEIFALIDGGSPLPEHPDYEWANRFLTHAYISTWYGKDDPYSKGTE